MNIIILIMKSDISMIEFLDINYNILFWDLMNMLDWVKFVWRLNYYIYYF